VENFPKFEAENFSEKVLAIIMFCKIDFRFVISGDVPVGKIHLRDPNSLAVLHTMDAHSGPLSDFDVHGNHVSQVASGNSYNYDRCWRCC
jgi:hypothetical protein